MDSTFGENDSPTSRKVSRTFADGEMTKDEALKLALWALEAHADNGIKSDKAITAIKEALANVATNDTSQERVDKTEKQRHWVELTDDEISACSKGNMTRSGFARTIEAKLREKNT